MTQIPPNPTLFEERPGVNRLLQPPPRRIRFSLRSQIILAALVMMALVALLYVMLRQEVLDGFGQLQNEFIERDTQRAYNAFNSQIASLDALAVEWAASPEIAAGAQGDSDAVLSQLSDRTMDTFDLSIALVFDHRGQMVLGKIFDGNIKEGMFVSPLLANAYLMLSGIDLSMADVGQYTEGIIPLPPVSVDALSNLTQLPLPEFAQFLNPAGSDPANFTLTGNAIMIAHEIIYDRAPDGAMLGTLVLGRLMPQAEYERIGQLTQTKLTAVQIDDPMAMADDFRAAREELLAGKTIVERNLDAHTAAGYVVLHDIQGKPALILRVEVERHITQQGLNTANAMYVIFAIAGLVLLGLILVMLEGTVIRRTQRLSRFVRRVSESGDVSLRSTLAGHDELADLNANINAMLSSLEESHKLLSESRQELTQILSSISDIVYTAVVTPLGEVVHHHIPSRQIETLTGYPYANFEADFEFWASLVVPEDLPKAKECLTHLVANEDSRIEYRIRNATGDLVWVSDHRHPRRVPGRDELIVYGVIGDITAQKNAEAELAAERNLLRTVIDTQANSVYVKDRHGRVLLCNPTDARWRNVARIEDALGKTDEDFYPPELAEKFRADDVFVMENNQPVINREERVGAPGQPVRWLLTNKVPLRDADGRVIGLVGAGQDITQRKLMEQALEQANNELEQRVIERTAEVAYERNLLRTLIDALPDNVFVKDAEGRFLAMNQPTALGFGLTHPDQGLGKTDTDFFADELVAKFRAEELALIRGEVSLVSREGPADTAEDGTPYGWYWTIKVPFRRSDGKVVGIVGIGRDISERKRMEEQLRAAHDELEQRVKERTADLRAAMIELRASEERFEQAFTYAPVGMALLGLDGRFLQVNPALAEMVGHSAEVLEGLTLADVTLPEDRDDTRAMFERVRQGEDEIHHSEKRYLHREGRIIWVSVTSSLVREAGGEPAYLVAQIQNITERKYAEAEREALIQKIQVRANELATAAQISHQATTILDVDRLLDTTVNLIKQNFGFYHVCIFRPDESGRVLIPAAANDDLGAAMIAAGIHIPIDSEVSLIARAALTRQTVLSNDAIHDPSYLPHPLLGETRSELAMPMLSGDELIGILDIEDDRSNRFTTDDVNILVTLAAQLANALYNARLFAENARRAAIIEQSSDLIALAQSGGDGQMIYVNPAGLRMIGATSAEDVIGRPATMFYTPAVLARLRKDILPAVMAQGSWRGEQQIRRIDGSTFPADQAILVIPGAPGQPPALATIATDITERKHAERALYRANRAYRVLSECSQAMVHAQDEQGLLDEICEIIVRASGYHMAWVGYPERPLPPDGRFEGNLEILIASQASGGMPLQELTSFLLNQAQIDEGRTVNGLVLQTHKPVVVNNFAEHFPSSARRQNLIDKGFRSSITLPLLIDDRPVGVLNVYSREPAAFDESEVDLLVELAGDLAYGIAAQRVRREREAAQDKLAESRANLIALIGNTTDQIWSVDSAYRLVTWNAAFQQQTIQRFGTAPQVGEDSLSRLTVPMQGMWRDHYERALTGEQFTIEQAESGENDLPIHLETAFNPIRAEGGAVTGVAVFSRDISRRKADEQRLRHLNLQLGQFNRTLLTLHEVGRTLTTALDPNTIYDVLYWALLNPLYNRPRCLVSLFDTERDELSHVYACTKGVEDDPASVLAIPGGSEPAYETVRTRQPRLIRYDGQDEVTPDPAVGVYVPLMSGDQVLGVLLIQHHDPLALTEDDIPLLSIMANQTAAALQNAMLFAAEREQRTLAEALRDVATALNSTLDPDTVLETILTSVRQVIPYDTASITMLDGEMVEMVHNVGYAGRVPDGWEKRWRAPLSALRYMSQMCVSGQPVVIQDTHTESGWTTIYSPEQDWIRSAIKAPLHVDGQMIGAIHLESTRPGAFSIKDTSKLMAFANQAASALRNARLFAAERDQRTFAEALSDTAAAINRLLEPEAVMDRILENIAQAIPYDAATIMLIDEHRIVRIPHHRGYAERGLAGWLSQWTHRLEALPFWPEIEDPGDVMLFEDTHSDERWVADMSDNNAWILSSLKAPLIIEGRLAGIINLDSAQVGAFDEQDKTRLGALADQAANAVYNARLFAAERDQRVLAEALRDTVATLNSSLDFDTVLERILSNVQHVIPHDTSAIMFFDGEEAYVRGSRGFDAFGLEEWIPRFRLKISESRDFRLVIERHVPVIIGDTASDPDWVLFPETAWIRSHATLPILLGDQVIGLLLLDSQHPNYFNESHLEPLRAFTDQAATAIKHAQTFTAEREQRAFAEALSDTAATINQVLELDMVLERILEHLQQVIPHDAANVMFIEDGVARIVRGHGYAERGLSEWVEQLRFQVDEVPVWRRMIATGQPFTVADTTRDADWVALAGPQEAWIKSTVKAPIKIDGVLSGILHIDSATPNTFDDSHALRLQAFAHQAANAIRNARLFAAERDQRTFAEALRDSAAAINSTLKHDEVLDRILINVEQVAPYDVAEIVLIENNKAYLARHRLAQPDWPVLFSPDAHQPMPQLAHVPNMQHMAETGQPFIVTDTQGREDWVVIPGWEWLRSQAAAPIKRQDRVIGFIMLDSSHPDFYAPAVAERLQAFADQAALALFNAEVYARVHNYAEELEEAVQTRTAELAAQHAQLQTILDTMAEGLIFSIDDELKYANRACEQLLGVAVNRLRGGLSEVLDHLSESSGNPPDVRGRIARTLDRGRVWQGDLSLVRADGHEFEAAVSVTPVPGLTEHLPSGLLTMIRDVSQEKALQAQRDRFIAHASHELRTPLANIKTRLYLLKNQPQKLEQHLQILERVSNDMTELVENLLDVSRFERGVITLSPRPMVLQDLIRDTVSVQQAEADQKRIALTVDLPEEPFHIKADPNRIRQVFTNMITNAINYTPEGGSVTISLEADPQQPEQRVICHVRDTGIGIDPSQITHVFEPFFRANQGTATGTGLGLAIAREIVLLHQGEIKVSSELGAGSVFSVVLDRLVE